VSFLSLFSKKALGHYTAVQHALIKEHIAVWLEESQHGGQMLDMWCVPPARARTHTLGAKAAGSQPKRAHLATRLCRRAPGGPPTVFRAFHSGHQGLSRPARLPAGHAAVECRARARGNRRHAASRRRARQSQGGQERRRRRRAHLFAGLLDAHRAQGHGQGAGRGHAGGPPRVGPRNGLRHAGLSVRRAGRVDVVAGLDGCAHVRVPRRAQARARGAGRRARAEPRSRRFCASARRRP